MSILQERWPRFFESMSVFIEVRLLHPSVPRRTFVASRPPHNPVGEHGDKAQQSALDVALAFEDLAGDFHAQWRVLRGLHVDIHSEIGHTST